MVLHGSPAQLDAAQPWLPVQRRLTAPAARRYVVGWAREHELHVLSPRLLAERASNVEGSLEMLMLAPSALLARRALAARHPGFPPPVGPRRLARWMRSAWFVEGAAQWLSGQTQHVRPAVNAAAARGARAVVPARAGPTRCCSAAPCSTSWRARRASARRSPPSAPGRTARSRRSADGAAAHTEQAWRSHLSRL